MVKLVVREKFDAFHSRSDGCVSQSATGHTPTSDPVLPVRTVVLASIPAEFLPRRFAKNNGVSSDALTVMRPSFATPDDVHELLAGVASSMVR
jgi:hypothetical protein